MGCFLACFGTSKKDRKPRRRHRNQVLPRGAQQQRNASFNSVQCVVSSVREESENPISLVEELSQKQPEVQPSLSTRKKVTFDSNVKTYEHVSTHDDTDVSPVSEEDVKKKEKEKERDHAKLSLSNCSSEESSITSSSLLSFPPNHRYQNCRESDDEEEELDFGDSDLDEDEDDLDDGELDYEDEIIAPKRVAFGEVDNEIQTIGLSRNARDRRGYVHSVLNPVENLSQWKAVKVKGGKPVMMLPQKENNFSLDQEPNYKELSLSFKSKNDQSIKPKQDMAVDASLSNWLVTPGNTTPISKTSSFGFTTPDRCTSQGSNSVKSKDEDRPILGALTVEEIRQFSTTNSPKKSPCRSPDEMPIIGTVGTYWSHSGATTTSNDSGTDTSFKGIPNTTSKYSEDRRVNWHTTPFETRLERALNRGGTTEPIGTLSSY
ncbi:uncharacterized protein LOC115714273 [Cannabis sativa]|uniref:Uncharacterized protein n=1 Tax=Cannabis sativa TaxID=3483 RepID=A0A7J6EIE3_CANSA|nr:uncharacterized protein LOC115714273 [Cannabis sativa]KAF4358208.1 hypothetical protein F8388_009491 [Cannabis sativa]KAF4387085.1 hypothetical protein G4B88_024657 [Cannabis sativa]